MAWSSLSLCVWLTAAAGSLRAGLGSEILPPHEGRLAVRDDYAQVPSRDLFSQWDDGLRRRGTDVDAWRRVKRGIKLGDGHVIESFKQIPGKGLNVAVTVISNITARDCAVYCIHRRCGAWSHRQDSNVCRIGCTKCDYVAVPVTSPGWDYYEMSVRKLGGALFKILTSGSNKHIIDVKPSQIRMLEDPLAPENVLTDDLGPPPTDPPPPPPTDLPPPRTTQPPVTAPPPPTPTTPPPTLSYEFDFPEDCGTRPTFGLSDNVRLLAPAHQEDVRVVGGTPVASGTYPWQAQIEVGSKKGFQHSCGGIVISPELIMTAGHCHTRNERNYQVRVAQHDRGAADPFEKILAVENTYVHSGYRPDQTRGQRNDIALFKLKFHPAAPQGLMFNDYVQPICLPSLNTTLFVGQECHISGWGLVDANQPKTAESAAGVLRGAIISVLDPALCRKAYGNRFDERLMVCAGRPEGGVDTCEGDSGGPLSCRDQTGQWFAAGIVSFGWRCGEPGNPGVYTRVSAYLEWVHRASAFLTGVSI